MAKPCIEAVQDGPFSRSNLVAKVLGNDEARRRVEDILEAQRERLVGRQRGFVDAEHRPLPAGAGGVHEEACARAGVVSRVLEPDERPDPVDGGLNLEGQLPDQPSDPHRL